MARDEGGGVAVAHQSALGLQDVAIRRLGLLIATPRGRGPGELVTGSQGDRVVRPEYLTLHDQEFLQDCLSLRQPALPAQLQGQVITSLQDRRVILAHPRRAAERGASEIHSHRYHTELVEGDRYRAAGSDQSRGSLGIKMGSRVAEQGEKMGQKRTEPGPACTLG